MSQMAGKGKAESILIQNKLPERDDTMLVDSDITDVDDLGSFAEDASEWSDGTAPDDSFSYHPESDLDMPNPSLPSAPEPEAAAAGSASASPVGEPSEPSTKKQKLQQDDITGVGRAGHTKVYSSPEYILKDISPFPGCMLSLNHNDWRWVSKWRKGIECEQWIDELQNKSYSQSFTLLNWEEKLKAVHSHAWTKWELSQPYCTALKLPAGVEPQTPGEIPQEVLDALEPLMNNLPAKKLYAKR